MSVASRNPFALLNEEAEPSPAPASKGPAAGAAPRKDAPKKTGPASRGGKYYARGGGAKPAASRDEGAEDSAPKERIDRGDRGRGRGRGRGGRGGGGGIRYDRHSQTGLSDSDKKLQQSWGGQDGRTELKQQNAAAQDASADVVAANADWGIPEGGGEDGWAAPAAADGATGDAAAPAEGNRRRVEEEEEDNNITFDEYLAKKTTLDLVPKLEGRKANDGQGDLWKDAVELKKSEAESEYFAGKAKAPPKARTRKEEKVHIEIDAHFPPPARGGRGRGADRGRGGDRARGGGRGRGGGYGGGGYGGRGPRQTDVDVDDQSAFPSLGA